MISCFQLKLLQVIKGFLLRLSAGSCFLLRFLLPARTLGGKQNHADSLSRKPFVADGILGSKKLHSVLLEAKYDGQSWQDGGVVYPCSLYPLILVRPPTIQVFLHFLLVI